MQVLSSLVANPVLGCLFKFHTCEMILMLKVSIYVNKWMPAWAIETHPRSHFCVFFFFSLLFCYSILAVLGVPMHFVHVLDPSSPNFDLLVTIWTFCTSICIDLECILILVWFYFVSELIQAYFRLTSSVDAILCQDGPQIIFSSLCKSHRSVRSNIGQGGARIREKYMRLILDVN